MEKELDQNERRRLAEVAADDYFDVISLSDRDEVWDIYVKAHMRGSKDALVYLKED